MAKKWSAALASGLLAIASIAITTASAEENSASIQGDLARWYVDARDARASNLAAVPSSENGNWYDASYDDPVLDTHIQVLSRMAGQNSTHLLSLACGPSERELTIFLEKVDEKLPFFTSFELVYLPPPILPPLGRQGQIVNGRSVYSFDARHDIVRGRLTDERFYLIGGPARESLCSTTGLYREDDALSALPLCSPSSPKALLQAFELASTRQLDWRERAFATDGLGTFFEGYGWPEIETLTFAFRDGEKAVFYDTINPHEEPVRAFLAQCATSEREECFNGGLLKNGDSPSFSLGREVDCQLSPWIRAP